MEIINHLSNLSLEDEIQTHKTLIVQNKKSTGSKAKRTPSVEKGESL